jgi:hypothetical protein
LLKVDSSANIHNINLEKMADWFGAGDDNA